MLNKEKLLNIIDDSLHQINPEKLINKACSFDKKTNSLTIQNSTLKIPSGKKIHLFASGKAVQTMAHAMSEIIGEDFIEQVTIVGPYEQDEKTSKIKNLTYLQSTHPLPSQKSVDAALQMTKTLQTLNKDDIFIYLLSGGTSALMELPVPSIPLDDFQSTTSLMLKNSMPIEAINCVRKHISQVKGGRLSNLTDATGYVLVLSDVLGDNLEDIGSSPFYFDKTTFEDAVNYLYKYKIFDDLPMSVKSYLENGCNDKVEETLKKEALHIKHFIIGSNSQFLHSIQDKLQDLDICAKVYENSIVEDVDTVCKNLLEFIDQNQQGCFIFGGEATVLVKGDGKGGRNQHLALTFLDKYSLNEKNKNSEILFLSVASDGIDGNSDAAGAIVDKSLLQKIKNDPNEQTALQNALNSFDSYSFFKTRGYLIQSGPTHNNMLDAVIIYINKGE